jgi:sec-independent protein translocase protein TatA
MPHLGPMELVILLVLVIMIFGLGKLPEVGGAIGKGIAGFRREVADRERPAQSGEKNP